MSSLFAYFPRNPDSEVQFNRPLTPIELNKVIFKGLPEKWRQQIKTNNPTWAKKSETDFKEMLKNIEKHDLATRSNPGTTKNKEKKTQSRKRQKEDEDTKAESWQTEGRKQHCHLCAMFGASESRINSHNTDQCKSAKFYKKRLSKTDPKSDKKDSEDKGNSKNGNKRRKISRESHAMEIDSSDEDNQQKKSQLFESFMNMMMNEFKKRKTEYSSDSY